MKEILAELLEWLGGAGREREPIRVPADKKRDPLKGGRQ